MKVFLIYISFFFNFTVHSATYIQIVDESNMGDGNYIQLGPGSSFVSHSYDNLLDLLRTFEQYKPLYEFLKSKRGELNSPLIIMEGEDFVLLDESFNYVITSSGEKLNYSHIDDTKNNILLSKALQDSMNYAISSDMYDFFQNKCTDSVFDVEGKKEQRISKVLEFLEISKSMKCSETLESGDTLEKFVNNKMMEEVLVGCIHCLSNKLSEKQIAYYLKKAYSFDPEDEGICKFQLANKVLTLLSKQEKEQLFHNILKKIQKNEKDVHYDHDEFGFKFQGEMSEDLYKYLLDYLDRFGTKDLTKAEKIYLSKQTNTIDDKSRKEPNDIMAWVLARNNLKGYGENQIYRNKLAREALARKLNPNENDNHHLEILPLSKFGKDDLGEDGVFVTCGNSKIKLYNKANKSGDRIYLGGFNYFSNINIINGSKIPVSQIRKSIKTQMPVFVECSNIEYQLDFDNNFDGSNVLDLSSLSEFKFSFGKDNTIEALSTLGLVSEMSFKLAVGMKFAFGAEGYNLVSEREVSGVKSLFLKNLETTDIYMPINHTMSLSSFSIGAPKGVEFVFERVNKAGKKVRLKIYTPPYTADKNNEESEADSDEIISSLSKRKDEDNNLFVLNLSCNADRTIPQWMHAYTGAVQVNVEKEILPPVVISSKRAFETATAGDIMKHMEYPFGVLKLAAEEAEIGEIMKFLNADPEAKVKASRSFAPISNIGKEFVEQNDKKISGKITKPDGSMESF